MYKNKIISSTRGHDIIERTQISLTFLTNYNLKPDTNQGTSEGSETLAQGYSTRRIRFFAARRLLGDIWKVILKKEVNNGFYNTGLMAQWFQHQRCSRDCRSPSGSLRNYFFVCLYWRSNPAVGYLHLGRVRVVMKDRKEMCGTHLKAVQKCLWIRILNCILQYA